MSHGERDYSPGNASVQPLTRRQIDCGKHQVYVPQKNVHRTKIARFTIVDDSGYDKHDERYGNLCGNTCPCDEYRVPFIIRCADLALSMKNGDADGVHVKTEPSRCICVSELVNCDDGKVRRDR